MIRTLRIWWLKRRMRALYATFHTLQCGDGGRHISNVISGGRISATAREFNALMDRLKQLDPAARDLPYLKED